MKIVLSPHFTRTFKKVVKRQPDLQLKIEKSIKLLEKNLYHPSLFTHKLSGDLEGLWSCSCGFEYRIVFSLEKITGSKGQIILLIDIGTHEEIY